MTRERVVYLASDDDWLVPFIQPISSERFYVDVVVEGCQDTDAESAISKARLIIASPQVLSNKLLSLACDLEFLQLTSTKYDSLDIQLLEERGIVVAGVNEVVAKATAIHVWTLIMELEANFGYLKNIDSPPTALAVKTIGLIGLGRLGMEIARRAKDTFGQVRYMDVRTISQGVAKELRLIRDSIDRMLIASDYVSVQVPLTKQSLGFLDRREFSLMKAGAIFVNASHPDVVNRPDLLKALENGEVAGVGITYKDPGLERAANVLSLPFLDNQNVEIVQSVIDLIISNIDRVMDGMKPRSVVESITFPLNGDPAFWSSRMAPVVGEDPVL